jgi:hypothetical protein
LASIFLSTKRLKAIAVLRAQTIQIRPAIKTWIVGHPLRLQT